MITTEFVMAVLCHPTSVRELLNMEKNNNVVILRRLDYDNSTAYLANDNYEMQASPVKLMFVFGTGDAIVVSSEADRREVQRRLSTNPQGVYAVH